MDAASNKVRLSTVKGVQCIFAGKEKIGEVDYCGLGYITFRFEPARFARTPNNLHILTTSVSGSGYACVKLGRC